MLAIAVLFLAGTQAFPETEAVAPSAVPDSKSAYQSPHCGIYCLYSVFNMLGAEVSIEELFNPRYLDDRVGSSILQLRQAVEDKGLYALPLSNLTEGILRESADPVIFHVRTSPESRDFDHYEVFMGVERGQALLYDPPGQPYRQPFSVLKTRWDGTGLFVSKAPISKGVLYFPFIKNVCVVITCCLSVALVLLLLRKALFKHRTGRAFLDFFRPAYMQAAVLMLLAVVGGSLQHGVSASGFRSQAQAVRSIQRAYLKELIPRVDAADLKLTQDEHVLIIDARRPADYKAGHIGRSINIPVGSTREERMQALKDVPKDTRIIAYCQSSSCSYAVEVAKSLQDDGFENISLFEGGWVEWQSQE